MYYYFTISIALACIHWKNLTHLWLYNVLNDIWETHALNWISLPSRRGYWDYVSILSGLMSIVLYVCEPKRPSFVIHRRKEVIQIRHKMRVIQWRQNFHFWVTCIFNSMVIYFIISCSVWEKKGFYNIKPVIELAHGNIIITNLLDSSCSLAPRVYVCVVFL